VRLGFSRSHLCRIYRSTCGSLRRRFRDQYPAIPTVIGGSDRPIVTMSSYRYLVPRGLLHLDAFLVPFFFVHSTAFFSVVPYALSSTSVACCGEIYVRCVFIYISTLATSGCLVVQMSQNKMSCNQHIYRYMYIHSILQQATTRLHQDITYSTQSTKHDP